MNKPIEEEIGADLESKPQIFAGDPGTEVARCAEDIKADAIVIASHEQYGWPRFMSGSVAEKVIRRTSISVSVIAVPEENNA